MSDQHQIPSCNVKLCKTEWSWELWIWWHKINFLDILSTSPHYFCRKWIGATNMRIQILILEFRGLILECEDMKGTRALISTFSLWGYRYNVWDVFNIEKLITDNNFHVVPTRPATNAASLRVVKSKSWTHWYSRVVIFITIWWFDWNNWK